MRGAHSLTPGPRVPSPRNSWQQQGCHGAVTGTPASLVPTLWIRLGHRMHEAIRKASTSSPLLTHSKHSSY